MPERRQDDCNSFPPSLSPSLPRQERGGTLFGRVTLDYFRAFCLGRGFSTAEQSSVTTNFQHKCCDKWLPCSLCPGASGWTFSLASAQQELFEDSDSIFLSVLPGKADDRELSSLEPLIRFEYAHRKGTKVDVHKCLWLNLKKHTCIKNAGNGRTAKDASEKEESKGL